MKLWRVTALIRRRILRVTIAVSVALALSLMGAVAAYANQIPLPDDPDVPQASVLYYRDGTTVLARLGVANRTDVPLRDVPLPVRRAVLAAEDRSFYDHFGLSLRGVVRAGWADLFGGRQGASTITQQYARNAYLTLEQTADRKAREAVLAMKIENRYTKDEILERYLNTIYFGRNAYGIAAAARAYFDTTPSQLTLAQGAVLASVIKDPWGFDPKVDQDAAKGRWQWVIKAMVGKSWISKRKAKATQYPDVLDSSATAASLSGPTGLAVDAVERELAAKGITPQMLRTGGLRVVTTLDERAQGSAINQLASLASEGVDLRAALVAVDPLTGGVRAYYGGKQGQGFFDDAAAQHSPASTFKPIVLAAGLNAGVSFMSRWDGSSPRTFAGRLGVALHNQKNLQCASCTLAESMVQSLNTPFYALTEQLGASTVRQLALDLGISPTYNGAPSLVDAKGDPRPGRTRSDIAIGRYAVTPADLSSVYATFAAGGVRTERHFVESVAGKGGKRWYTAAPSARRVLDPAVAADVTAVLHSVAQQDGEPVGHEAAAKTGTQQWGNTSQNQDAWMAGYTPQLATTVWIGKAIPGPIRDAAGAPIAGDGLPSRLWRDFMANALTGSQPVALPQPAHVGRTDVGDAGKAKRNGASGGSTSDGLKLVDHTRSSGKALALTFDDGPSQYTTSVLDLLAQYHIKATFCLVGDQVAGNRDVVRRMVAEGHELCAHSMHHDDLGAMTEAKVKEDLLATISEIKAVAPAARVDYYRAPFGSWGSSAAVGASLGMTPLAWTVDPEDWNTPGVEAIVRAVTEQLRQGGIVLMHDGGGSRTQTIEALKILIPQLRGDGWTFDLPAETVPPVTIHPSSSKSTGQRVSPTPGSSKKPASGEPSGPVTPPRAKPGVSRNTSAP